jgi:hypothetical protein
MATLHIDPSTLKMEAAGSSKTVISTILNGIVIGEYVHSHFFENLESNRNLSQVLIAVFWFVTPCSLIPLFQNNILPPSSG